ncbi:MAG: YggS family pyridoxal phosphate-dependent enzyme [Acutalibacteraceae bacterium]|nr:YggS family pyridoxal phosphate-dependent enzyme [Acutalibacteraceae bacterium]
MNSFKNFDENYSRVCEKINEAAVSVGKRFEDVTLLAATKTVPVEIINYSYTKGIKYMGENRVQEFLSKEEQLDKGFHRQFIGTLQTNKVKQIVGRVELIQSVDSLKLAKEISKHSVNKGIVSDILVEINIGDEQAKSGIDKSALNELLGEISNLEGVFVKGLMTLGPIFENNTQKSQFFEEMYKLFIDNSTKIYDNISMDILSMGMSNDYDLAIKCGANMVRVGSALYGKRIYN